MNSTPASSLDEGATVEDSYGPSHYAQREDGKRDSDLPDSRIEQRGPYPNIRANEHKWRPIGSNENMPWVVVTIPDELEKNGQPQNEKD